VIANDYPKESLEVLVIDGMSEDGTRMIVESYTKKYSLIRMVDNPNMLQAFAVNIGIINSKGQILIRMDAHNTYPNNYISKCVTYLESYDADNVGGIWKIVPRKNTLVGWGIAIALSHPFGIGNAFYRFASGKPRWVDTAAFFCCRREIFQRIGLFNEKVPLSEDMEFNRRLSKGGGRVLLVPDIVSNYHARSDIQSFWKHNIRNGLWVVLPFQYSDVVPVSWRHLVPVLFVTTLLSSAILAFNAKPFLWLFLLILGSYGLANLVSSFQITYQKRDIRYLIVMPFIFGVLHFGYGFGSLWGVFKVLAKPEVWGRLLRLIRS
jgi:glycosyltransferase involved in cell wall biosynthesis